MQFGEVKQQNLQLLVTLVEEKLENMKK